MTDLQSNAQCQLFYSGRLELTENSQGKASEIYCIQMFKLGATRFREKSVNRALVLDDRNERLAEWYAKHDFMKFLDSLRMFKSIEAICKLKLT